MFRLVSTAEQHANALKKSKCLRVKESQIDPQREKQKLLDIPDVASKLQRAGDSDEGIPYLELNCYYSFHHHPTRTRVCIFFQNMFYLFFKLLTKTFSLEIYSSQEMLCRLGEQQEEKQKKNLIDFIHEMFVIFFLKLFAWKEGKRVAGLGPSVSNFSVVFRNLGWREMFTHEIETKIINGSSQSIRQADEAESFESDLSGRFMWRAKFKALILFTRNSLRRGLSFTMLTNVPSTSRLTSSL